MHILKIAYSDVAGVDAQNAQSLLENAVPQNSEKTRKTFLRSSKGTAFAVLVAYYARYRPLMDRAMLCMQIILHERAGCYKQYLAEDGMKRLHTLWLLVVGIVLCIPAYAVAAGGGGAPIVIVADTRRLDGIMLWWAQMYNDSHLYFTILTIIIIPATGLIFGLLADVIMGHIGIDLKNRDLAEH